MVQRIKVQSGQVVYEAADSSFDIHLDVKGSLDVGTEINIGTNGVNGVISTPAGESITISPSTNGNLTLNTSGTGIITIKGSSWPTGTGTPNQVLTTNGSGTLSWQDAASNNTVENGIVAAGTDLASATPLTSNYSVVGTSGSGTGVSLPAGPPGFTAFVLNETVNDILVYPDSLSSKIDVESLGAGYTLPAGYRIALFYASSTQWYTIGVPFTP